MKLITNEAFILVSSKVIIEEVHVNPLNAQLNPICHLLALLGAHPIFHVSRIRVNISDIIYLTF
jgi:hypothetical protein